MPRQTDNNQTIEELQWVWSKDEVTSPTTGQGLREWVGKGFSRKEASEMGPKNERKVGYHQEMKTKVE